METLAVIVVVSVRQRLPLTTRSKAGLLCTVIGDVGSEIQPFEACVNLKVAVPPLIPVTTPPEVTDAMAGLELTQVPPDTGVSWVVL